MLTETKPRKELNKISCFHCGEDCADKSIAIGEKYFCCNGCKTVFELLSDNNLCNYYQIEDTPGISQLKPIVKNKFEYLDDEDLIKELIEFTDGKITKITFYMPQIHCSSCIWLLENLYNLSPGVKFSQVNFLKKEVTVKYSNSETTLRKVVELLASIGYEPLLNLDKNKESVITNKSLYYKIGVAGFSFGNIMLLSFPEYLSFSGVDINNMGNVFLILNFILALPILLYCSSEYYISAFKGLRKGWVNIDVPITLGILVLFARSAYEVISQTGTGYFDSLSGLVFFLLLGKLFQSKTYETLNFERNYKSYFPISITLKKDGIEKSIPVSKLEKGNRIVIRNQELVPADAVLIKGDAHIDYSFVTGESDPISKEVGEMIYAGGKQYGGAIELDVVKDVSQSYLTELWNNDAFTKSAESKMTSMVNVVSKYFTFIILAIAAATFLFWFTIDIGIAISSFTAVLIVACPCALALSTPFTLGSTLRIFGKNQFYLKNTSVVEALSKITSIVFDKTGTLTETGTSSISFVGEDLSSYEKGLVKTLVRNSSHPLSKRLSGLLESEKIYDLKKFSELSGKGISGIVDNNAIMVGSESFVFEKDILDNNIDKMVTKVYIKINNVIKGYYIHQNKYRDGINKIISYLKEDYQLSVLSGDNEGEKNNLENIFGNDITLNFNQSPQSKYDYIKEKQSRRENVLMIGDGLNDAGALKKSNVGITISEDINNFSPSCDAILDSKKFIELVNFITFSKTSIKIIKISFVISFLYNLIGLSFAITGNLSPIIAAILMPLSSITVVVFTTVSINIIAKKRRLL
ncbi:MAG: heavy metal translocating P-type ATPase metal-binding domain-containing protein [Melioribacteraceae bacterium]|nr:heavy metal translocating P-type ATPase metal-binding domain-containing protein [Melioribacteraceae bacterium]